MSKIAPEHLNRQAFVYVRQSTQDQVLHNHESRRRQYGLADRARQLGWAEPWIKNSRITYKRRRRCCGNIKKIRPGNGGN